MQVLRMQNPVRWSRIEIDSTSIFGSEELGIGSERVGLDIDAEKMHEQFLSEIPHLSEVQTKHGELVGGVSSSAEASKNLTRSAVTVGEFLDEIGGAWSGGEIRVPIRVNSREEVTIEATSEEGVQLVRIIAPERFGGLVRTFSLPEGRSVVSAFWEGETLTMSTASE